MFNHFDETSGNDPEVQQANWQGWTPPWMQGEGPGPRGPFGHGHHHHHHHGHGWRGPFGRGFGFFGFGPGRGWGIPDEILALRAQAMEVGRLFMIAARGAFENKERLNQLRAFLERSHKELSDMIYGGSSQGQPTPGSTSEGTGTSTSPDVEQA
ncbi:MAG TPA: hypothetical protein VFA41_14075 [Ktedonobacteraceae bacterium]|jgi:hypothetical protein|nr:hypothetical protein [Ktedonobacteraceae bacterium]